MNFSSRVFSLTFIFIFIFISLASAAPPMQQQIFQFETGYIIEDVPQSYLKQNHDFTYSFFLYNITNGMPLSNASGIRCEYYIADIFGNLQFYSPVTYGSASGYWSVTVDKSNFSTPGTLYHGTKCNSSVLGGATVG